VLVCVFFFFFQAEDGIRDRNVTGVQTCALPILLNSSGNLLGVAAFWSERGDPEEISRAVEQHPDWLRYAWLGVAKYKASKNDFRSEERRVGKERRSRRGTKQ